MEDQITRINKKEAALDASAEAVRDLTAALERYEAVADRYRELEEYYGSEEWKSDFEADEAGLLPVDLNRGVLSEDSVYDLITEHENLLRRMTEIVRKIGFILQTTAEKLSSAGHTTIIYASQPVFVALFSYMMLGEPITIRQIVGIIVVFIGVLITINPQKRPGQANDDNIKQEGLI